MGYTIIVDLIIRHSFSSCNPYHLVISFLSLPFVGRLQLHMTTLRFNLDMQ